MPQVHEAQGPVLRAASGSVPRQPRGHKRVEPVSQVLVGSQALAACADALDSLIEATAGPPAAGWTALEVWLRNHPEQQAWAVVLRCGERLDAAIVLSRRWRWGGWVIERAGERGEPGWLAARDKVACAALADAVVAALGTLHRPWLLRIVDLPLPCLAVDALVARLVVTRVESGPVAPRLRFEPDATVHAYLSRNTRAAVAKARNRIRRERDSLDVCWTDEADAIERCLGEIIAVHRARNLQLRGAAGIDDPDTAASILGNIRAHANRRRTWLLTVRIDRELAAFAVCFVAGGTLWVYSNLASPAWLRYSPGTIANAEIVRRAFADPNVHTLDWGTGIQRYKLSGNATLQHSQQISAWSSRAAWMLWSGRQWLLRS